MREESERERKRFYLSVCGYLEAFEVEFPCVEVTQINVFAVGVFQYLNSVI